MVRTTVSGSAERSTVVFDLFHTLIDPEPWRPAGFDRIGAVSNTCGFERDPFEAFWTATYVERETTTVDLIELVGRHATAVGVELTAAQSRELDGVFGAAEDAALLRPDERLVRLVAGLADVAVIGVLSNCHEHEVRRWSDSPFAPHVSSFGRSSRIGAMKPERRAYEWILDDLGSDRPTHPDASIYVGNGGSDELAGARDAGFTTVIHCNAIDRLHRAVDRDEQRRRAGQADASVDTVDDLTVLLGRLVPGR